MFDVPYYAAILLQVLRNFGEHSDSRYLVMLPRFKCKVKGQGVRVNRTARHARAVSPEFGCLRYLGMSRGPRIVVVF